MIIKKRRRIKKIMIVMDLLGVNRKAHSLMTFIT